MDPAEALVSYLGQSIPHWLGQQFGQPIQPSFTVQSNPPTTLSWTGNPVVPTGQAAQPPCPTLPNPLAAPKWPGNLGKPADQPVHPSCTASQFNQPVMSGWPGNPGQPGWLSQSPLTYQPWPCQPARSLTVPYTLSIPRGVYDKMLITIDGQVNPHPNKFTINFLRGNDIAFHMNPRFNEGGRQVIVRNHRVGDRWGKEERDLQTPFPFTKGQPFEIKILCTYNEFKVAVNNSQVLDFKHRIRELNQVDRIDICDDISLTSITVDTLP